MILSLPTTLPNDLEAPLSGHFGKAPFQTLVAIESHTPRLLGSLDVNGQDCSQLWSILLDKHVSVVICQNMGQGAFTRLHEVGILVYRAHAETLAEAIEAFTRGQTRPLTHDALCQDHQHGTVQ